MSVGSMTAVQKAPKKLADAVNEFVLGALSEYVRPKS